jgi:threonine/homoserine/homoserine lactone efflux protein
VTETIREVLPYAVALALSPIPIVAVILMLSTPRGRVNGPVFLLGWVLGAAVPAAVVVGLVDGGGDAEPPAALAVAEIVFGAVFAVLAVQQWRQRSRPEGHQLPSWLAAVDDFGPRRAFVAAVVLSAVNPKNLAMSLSAARAIAEAGLDAGQELATLAVFVVLASLGAAVPVVVYLAGGDRVVAMLQRWKAWLSLHSATALALVCVIIAVVLLRNGISDLRG